MDKFTLYPDNKYKNHATNELPLNKLTEFETEVRIDAGGYPYIPIIELYDYEKDVPLAKKGDKVKVIIMTMNYEKKYKETVEKFREALAPKNGCEISGLTRDCVEEILPELKESEDEKIRKRIIHALHGDVLDMEETNKALAWLEKQGQVKENADSLTQDNDEQKPSDKVELTPIFHIGDTLKRKGGDYTFIVDRIQGGYYHCDHKNGAFFPIEEQDNWELVEQKSADEPKFKKGQWIVWQGKCYKVNYNGCGYELVGQYGLSTSLEYSTVDESAHLWDISDAKDGDVLVVNGNTPQYMWIGIFKEHTGITFSSHCHYNCGMIEFVTASARCKNHGSGKHIDIRPATKEEYDLLFQKMKEAGYEWDAEKLELRKIEEELTEFENVLADVCRGWIGEEIGWKDYIIKNSLPLLELAKKQFEEYEQKPSENKDAEQASIEYRKMREECGIKDPVMLDEIEEAYYEGATREQKPSEWSKGDKDILNDAITAIDLMLTDSFEESHPNLFKAFLAAKGWLKSLPQRFGLQPKQGWSEEDKKKIDYICEDLRCAVENFKNGKNVKGLHYEEIIESNIDWLKSLKDRIQSKVEWSEEDSKRLQRIIDFLWYNRKGDTDTIYQQEQDIDWLKSLRPQNHWKPSDEQLDALQYVFQNITPPLSDKLGWDSIKQLGLLYQDLKKLKD